MKERRQIIDLVRQNEAQTAGGEAPALIMVTLVRAEGSSYRRPGARLLIAPDGRYAGTISGGCLESEVLRKAAWMVSGGAQVERYTTAFDDTADIPFGLGCGGTVDLLFEPLGTPEGAALLQALAQSLAGEVRRIVHFLPGGGRGLRRLVLDAAGNTVFRSAALSDDKIACARALVPDTAYDGRFVEQLQAPQRLLLLGAGDDARPMVEIASQLGWRVVVAEGRAQLTRAPRFPLAERVVAIESLQDLHPTAADALVLMTHSYEQDRHFLMEALPVRPRYLGLLGSRHRSSLLVSEAAAHLQWPVEQCCAGLFAPVGLDLGGDGPEAIALAVIAEIQAVCHGRMGAVQRLTPGQVQALLDKGDASPYLRAHCALEGA